MLVHTLFYCEAMLLITSQGAIHSSGVLIILSHAHAHTHAHADGPASQTIWGLMF